MQKISKIERPGSLQSLAYDKIKGLLMAGQLEFDTIYSTNQFAEILGVSRTPIREALIQLTAEGLLISMQGRGFRIKEFSEKKIRDFFETRKMIESYVIERLVGVMTEKDLKQLNDSFKQMIDAADKSDIYSFLEADKAFHMYLVHRYNNRLFESTMEKTRDFISIFGKKALSISGRFQEVINEHRNILQALQHQDKENAVKSMNYHLNTTEKYLLP